MVTMAKRMSKTPVKVYETTREKIRIAAAVRDTIQAEIMEAAVDEYIERHAEDFALGLKLAREALLAGHVETAAYLLDEDVEAVRRVAGSSAPTPPEGTGARSRAERADA
jgi:hypothetical protein